jgi:glyoxylase-like metal-dependent hydrolase (beta-lactamase superfamily II)
MFETSWKVETLLTGSWRGATSVLVSNGGRYIVVDSGMPHESHQLVKALDQRGLRPADIGTLVNTHFHIDHVLNNDLFPAATIYATQESYDWCQSMYSDVADDQNWEKLALKYYPEMYDYERAWQHMAKLRKFVLRWWDLKRLGSSGQFRWLETHSLPDGIEAFITGGHVPGHVSLVVRRGEQRTIIAGDALLSRESEEKVATMIPHNREQFLKDRARVLQMGGRILPGHDSDFRRPLSPKSDMDSSAAREG